MSKYVWIGAGLVLGAIGGFLYWKEIGCLSGSCAITSVWYNSTMYGSVMGALLGSIVKDMTQKKKDDKS